jgi:hypothetical protein
MLFINSGAKNMKNIHIPNITNKYISNIEMNLDMPLLSNLLTKGLSKYVIRRAKMIGCTISMIAFLIRYIKKRRSAATTTIISLGFISLNMYFKNMPLFLSWSVGQEKQTLCR